MIFSQLNHSAKWKCDLTISVKPVFGKWHSLFWLLFTSLNNRALIWLQKQLHAWIRWPFCSSCSVHHRHYGDLQWVLGYCEAAGWSPSQYLPPDRLVQGIQTKKIIKSFSQQLLESHGPCGAAQEYCSYRMHIINTPPPRVTALIQGLCHKHFLGQIKSYNVNTLNMSERKMRMIKFGVCC